MAFLGEAGRTGNLYQQLGDFAYFNFCDAKRLEREAFFTKGIFESMITRKRIPPSMSRDIFAQLLRIVEFPDKRNESFRRDVQTIADNTCMLLVELLYQSWADRQAQALERVKNSDSDLEDALVRNNIPRLHWDNILSPYTARSNLYSVDLEHNESRKWYDRKVASRKKPYKLAPSKSQLNLLTRKMTRKYFRSPRLTTNVQSITSWSPQRSTNIQSLRLVDREIRGSNPGGSQTVHQPACNLDEGLNQLSIIPLNSGIDQEETQPKMGRQQVVKPNQESNVLAHSTPTKVGLVKSSNTKKRKRLGRTNEEQVPNPRTFGSQELSTIEVDKSEKLPLKNLSTTSNLDEYLGTQVLHDLTGLDWEPGEGDWFGLSQKPGANKDSSMSGNDEESWTTRSEPGDVGSFEVIPTQSQRTDPLEVSENEDIMEHPISKKVKLGSRKKRKTKKMNKKKKKVTGKGKMSMETEQDDIGKSENTSFLETLRLQMAKYTLQSGVEKTPNLEEVTKKK